MNVTISGRHMKVTQGLKDHIENGLDKIRHHFDKVIDVEVILSVQKNEHQAEFNMHANGLRINAKDSSSDMYASIDGALAKVGRQVTKHKDRIQRRQPRTAKETAALQADGALLEEAAVSANNAPAAIGHRVIDREKVALKSMSVDQAAVQLDLLEDSFLVFSNAETQQVNVVYTRDDGTYAVIEPQF